ncbi:uncharacterized protein LOC144579836 isoform X4 [Callithrix jacchus]
MKYAEGGKRRPLPEKLVSRATSPVNWGEGWTFGTLREYSGPCRRDGWSSTSGKTRVTSSSIPVLRTTSRWPTRKPGPSPWDMDESEERHPQQTDTRTENETPHILTHRRVMKNENTWTQKGEY